MTANQRWWRIVFLISIVGFVLRLAVVFSHTEQSYLERGYTIYLHMADAFLEGKPFHHQIYTTQYAYRTPGYPLILAGLKLVSSRPWWLVGVLNCIFGALTISLSAYLGQLLFGARAGIITSLCVSLYPYYVFHDGSLQDTALYTLLLAGALTNCFLTVEKPTLGRASLIGALFALAFLVRFPLILTAVLCLGWIVWRLRKQPRMGAIAIFSFCLGISPWLVRNHVLTGAPLISSDFGRSIWIGNNPWAFSLGMNNPSMDLAEAKAWETLGEEARRSIQSMNEREQQRHFAWLAFQYMTENPLRTIKEALLKIAYGFSLRKQPPTPSWLENIAYSFTYGPLFLVSMCSWLAWRKKWRELTPLFLSFLAFAIQTAFTFAYSGYRIYLDLYLMVLASAYLTRVSFFKRLPLC